VHFLSTLHRGRGSKRMSSSRMLRRAALVRVDVSEEISASIIRVKIELGT
jgi:hypothetical protein